MNQLPRLARSPFGSAAIGGLVVGALGWIAIAAGWIASPESEPAASPALAATVSDPEESRGGLSVNEIYDRASRGVAFIEASGGAAEGLPDPFGGPAPSSRPPARAS